MQLIGAEGPVGWSGQGLHTSVHTPYPLLLLAFCVEANQSAGEMIDEWPSST